MSCSYSFYIRVGFQITTQDLKDHFKHQNVTHEEGIFHMEDRFDPKTGAKLAQVQVWDKKPKNKTETWWEIDGERFDDWEDDPMTQVFQEKLGCNVDAYWQAYGSSSDDEWSYGFYPHPHNNKETMGDGNKFTIHNPTMDYREVLEMQSKLQELKEKLQAMGLNPGDAKIFVGEISG